MTDNNKNFIKHVPNILTTGRLVLTGFFLWMILISDNVSNRARFIDIAFVFFVITGLTDIVDGYIARRFNATSKYGRIVDPLADKILICGAYICFAIIGRPLLFGWSQSTLSAIHWGIVAVLIFRELSVTIIRQWAENRNFKFPASVYGKLKMFTQSFGVGTILVKMAHLETAQWAYWFTAVTLSIMIFATLVSGFEALFRMFIAVKDSKKPLVPSA
ncbi:Putative CDP-diacylglycerol--glycerol-3-phosphate 3-phosphatidyl-transferase 2 [Limihaloglobus sulfuriphilus]|uniref:CDP-diacylglycerol--glycerol-3-phosphate 3-phosphatidyltransferase n=1 Tax=Limihaloglobus sulfuriphilus TaxID=1851148 RepID=A0A1Q2MDR5_9BACT|nr:CDP-alcohol phosphatidyltransferase family protein [Limihaloglobus sulfuriphilus]AQQ70846.1 Putative CDP-diacylglycerol--glycerol-3-phosphate 3-phosphatidyl-transferase 2 [Limihaloglobus sulfuriphilus]